MINWPHMGLYGEFSNCEEGVFEAINRNFFLIDSILQMKVVNFVENLPSIPNQGDIYIVEDSSYTYTSGSSYIMIWNGISWQQVIPKAGFIAWVSALENFYYFNGVDWKVLPKTIGDVSGPSDSLNNSIARFDGTTGKFITDSGVTIDNDNVISGVSGIYADSLVSNSIYINELNVSSENTNTAGPDLLSPQTTLVRLTGTITTVESIAAPVNGKAQIHIYENMTGHSVSIKNSATVRTGTGSDLDVEDGASIFVVYSDLSSQWIVVGGSGSGSGVLVVADIAARNNIPENKRKRGMLVQVISEDQIYKLIGLPLGATTTDTDWDAVITSKATQVITAKDIDGGTASNTSRFTVPKGTASDLHALARKEATVLENTESKQLMLDDGTKLNAIPKFGNTDTMFVDIAANEVLAGWTQTFTGSTAAITRSTSTDVAPYAYRLANALSDNLGTLKLTRLVDVPKGFNGQRLNISFDYASTILDGFGLSVYDMTNSAYIIGYDNSDDYKIPAANIPTKANYVFDVPLTCTQIRIELHKKLGFDLVGGVFSFNNTRIGKWSPNVAITEGPKSMVRFTGGNTRGSTDSSVLYFPKLAEQYGTGFTAVTDSTLGTRVTMLRAGILDISLTLNRPAASGTVLITKNSNSSSAPEANQVTGLSQTTGGGFTYGISGKTRVQAGDVIRVTSATNNTSNAPFNTFSLILHEDNLAARFADYTLNQDISFVGFRAASQAASTTVNVKADSVKDTVGAWDAANGEYEVKSAGDFDVEITAQTSTSGGALVYKNGTNTNYFIGASWGANGVISGSVTIPNCVVGDKLSIRLNASFNLTNSYISVSKRATSQQVFTPIAQRYIVRSGFDATTGFEWVVNNNGWVELSAANKDFGAGAASLKTVNFPFNFKDIQYSALQSIVTTYTGATNLEYHTFKNKTVSSVQITSDTNSRYRDIVVKGFGDSAAVKALGANPNY